MRFSLLAAILFTACSSSSSTETTPDGGGFELQPDSLCGGQKLDLTYVAPNLGIVLDRSCSMPKPITTGSTVTKWEAAVGSLDSVISQHASDVRWGLTMFPDTTGESCGQDTNAMPLGDGNDTAIRALLNNALATTDVNYPKAPCVTNIDSGLKAASTDPGIADPVRKSYMMLVTDGAQSAGCTIDGGDAGAEAIVHDMFVNHDTPTFVVGFGGAVDATQLTKLATKGGKPRAGATKYYKADTAADLDTVFAEIAETIVSCSYTVNQAPTDLAQTWVYYDTTELVDRDTTHAGGWDFDPTTLTLTFYGTACERLQSHAVTNVDVLFGCPTPPIL